MEEENSSAEKKLQLAASMLPATAAMAEASKTGPKWQRYAMYVFISIGGLATIAGVIGNLASFVSLPDCDTQQTRDLLSDLNRDNKFNATKYNFIKSVSTSDSEVSCTANLALKGGSAVEYDYRIFWEGSKTRVAITNIRR